MELATLPEKQEGASGQRTTLPEPARALEKDLAEASPEMPVANGRQEHRYGDGAPRIIDFRLIDASGRAVTRLRSLETYSAVMTIRALRQTGELCAGVLVRNGRGENVFGTDTMRCQNLTIAPLAPGEEAVVHMRLRANMAAGTYFFTAALARHDSLKHDVRFDAIMVEVAPVTTLFTDTIVNLEPEFRIARREGATQEAAGPVP